MTAWICGTCANQHADTPAPPAVCAICADERQWVPQSGQQWTTLPELAAEGYRSDVRELEPDLLGIGVTPQLAIGQRALLVRTAEGNLLWDPPGYLDDAAIAAVREAGGLAGIAASHPHFYGVIVEWSHAFGGAPVLIPESDVDWLMRPDPAVRSWAGSLDVLPGVRLVQCGGHFAGSAVVHWAGGAEGRGALFVGDTLMVTPGEDRISFIRSAPNYLPLPRAAVEGVVAAVAPYSYDRIYGGWWNRVVRADGQRILRESAERYVAWLTGAALAE